MEKKTLTQVLSIALTGMLLFGAAGCSNQPVSPDGETAARPQGGKWRKGNDFVWRRTKLQRQLHYLRRNRQPDYPGSSKLYDKH